MSKGEWKNNKIKIICFGVAFVCIVSFVIFFLKAESAEKKDEKFLLSENAKIEYEDGEKITLEASVSKKEFFEKLAEKGIKIPPLLSILPERIDVLCDAIINISAENEKPSVSILSLSFNGLEIPSELLSEIGEFNLDFKRSLVYN